MTKPTCVRLQTLLQVEKLIANSMDPDQTARMRGLVWIHAGRKRIMLVLSWRGSYNNNKHIIDIRRYEGEMRHQAHVIHPILIYTYLYFAPYLTIT
jgi:hypothetical protein